MRAILISILVASVLLGRGLEVSALAAVMNEGDDPRFGVIDDFLAGLAQNGFSGGVLVSDGRHVFNKCYGMADRENKIPCDAHTVFETGSVTKQFTGAAILKLEMQGKLSVTDTIDKYLKGVPDDKKSITLHHLLTHSSGFPGDIGRDYEPLERDAFLERAMKTPLRSKPGEKYEYSNAGYSILSAIIEIVSKQTYEQYLNKNLFTPAGMTQTGYKLPKWDLAKLAVGYEGAQRWGKMTEKPWGKDGPYWNLLGNGGILSTTGDMYKWHLALLGDKILNRAAKEKYYKRHIEEGVGAGTYYGYGWALFPTPRNTTLITHNGGNGVYFCDVLRYVEEGVTVIVFTNAARGEYEDLGQELAKVFFKPGYKPVLEFEKTTSAPTLDGHPDRQLIEGFLKVISTGDPAEITAFVNANFSPGFIARVPIDQRLQNLTKRGSQIKGAEITSVEVTGNRTVISFKDRVLKIGIIIGDGKIGGLGFVE